MRKTTAALVDAFNRRASWSHRKVMAKAPADAEFESAPEATTREPGRRRRSSSVTSVTWLRPVEDTGYARKLTKAIVLEESEHHGSILPPPLPWEERDEPTPDT
ncbi:MAG: hypothetical protein QM778_33530 [Myxococcales bacterium]